MDKIDRWRDAVGGSARLKIERNQDEGSFR